MKPYDMKNAVILSISIIFWSCSGGKETKEATTALKGMADMMSETQGTAERQKELKAMKPLSEEAFLSWAPDAVLGLSKQESTEKTLPFEKYNYSGYDVYYKGNDKKVHLTIKDGAGSTNYVAYANMLSSTAMNTEREGYYEKNMERKGMTVNEWYDSERNDTGILFLVHDRFVVIIDGADISPEEIWDNFDDFEFDKLGL